MRKIHKVGKQLETRAQKQIQKQRDESGTRESGNSRAVARAAYSVPRMKYSQRRAENREQDRSSAGGVHIRRKAVAGRVTAARRRSVFWGLEHV